MTISVKAPPRSVRSLRRRVAFTLTFLPTDGAGVNARVRRGSPGTPGGGGARDGAMAEGVHRKFTGAGLILGVLAWSGIIADP